ncbi:MAG: hypothetical protein H7Z19_08520 [Chitinophagaceae bacterium]|nr:hypothetical protein [Rubrivivax sp.]
MHQHTIAPVAAALLPFASAAIAASGAIRGIWEQIAKSQGAHKLSADKVEESANAKCSTVSFDIHFEGSMPANNRHVTAYQDEGIGIEALKIGPNPLVVAAR